MEADAIGLSIEERDDGSVALSGPLTAATVPEVWEAGQALLGKTSDILLDLGGVSRCDSAGVALVVNWIAAGRSSGGAVSVRDVPEQMRAILEVSDLSELITPQSVD